MQKLGFVLNPDYAIEIYSNLQMLQILVFACFFVVSIVHYANNKKTAQTLVFIAFENFITNSNA